MKEFLAGFQVDTENKALAGVCAGLGNYFNIQANIVRLVTVLLFLSSTEIGILTVTAYAYLAGCLSSSICSIRSSTVGCSAGGSCHPFVYQCCTIAQNKTLFQIGEYYENT